jgi:hypothetical protein
MFVFMYNMYIYIYIYIYINIQIQTQNDTHVGMPYCRGESGCFGESQVLQDVAGGNQEVQGGHQGIAATPGGACVNVCFAKCMCL